MDDSWRFRPIQSNICPTCSISHFPFCPPPPAFDRNGYPGENLRSYPPDIDPPFRRRLQDPPFHRPLHDPPFHRPPLHDPPFHRPLHDPPFPDHRQLPPPVPLPMPVVKGPELWSSNLPTERDPLRPDWHPSPQFFHEEFLERESFRKRMRVEEPSLGNFPPSQPYNRYDLPPSRNSLDDERMLNLIRDHGQHNTTTYEADSGYQDRIIGMDRGFYDPGIGSAARNGPVLPPEPPLSDQNRPWQASSYEGYQNFPVGPSSQSSDRFLPQERRDFQRGEFDINKSGVFNSQIGEDPYGRKGQYDPSLQLPHRYRHGDSIENSENYEFRAPVERPFYDSYPQVSSTASAPVERPFYDSFPQVSSTASDYASRGPYEKYYGHDPQQLHLNGRSSSILPNQPQHPHNDSNQLPSNVVIHERESAHPFHAARHPIESKFEPHGQHVEAMRTPLELKPPVHEDIYKPPVHENIYSPFDSQRYPLVEQSGGPSISTKHGGYIMPSSMLGQMHNPQKYPPLPLLPLPPVHDEPPALNFQVTSSMSAAPPVLSHAPASTSVTKSLPPSTSNFAEPHLLPQIDFYKEPQMHDSFGLTNEGLSFINQTSLKQYPEEGGQTFPLKHSVKDKPIIIDASHLFKHPNRTSRPDYIVIILRGLPGSGKSYLAKAIRDIEVENGGNVPRIHAMDDYFMIEVEKVEDNDGSKSSSSFRGKKQITKKVVEYCYEREMEEAYRSSMLKAFKKTLEEGVFTFIIVDDRNLRVADFAQFWAIAKRSGYEVYLLEAAYKDPAGCAARNVHGFTLDDIQKMAEQWEEAPSLYHQLDIQPLFHGDDLNEHSIEEVDMDTDDTACDEEDMSQSQGGEVLKMTGSESVDHAPDVGLVKVGDRWDSEEDEELTEVKELKRSKWSRDLDEDIENPNGAKENLNALSGLIQAYGKGEKSVHWGDRVDNGGFSIGAVNKKNISSLVIGPGSGYNLNSNPLLDEANDMDGSGISIIGDSKRRFHEQLRAERESFKAVFDRRRHRIGGLFNSEDET